MNRSFRIRLLLVAFTTLAIAGWLAPAASAGPPICWYDTSCVHDCWLACFGQDQTCQQECNETYCKICP